MTNTPFNVFPYFDRMCVSKYTPRRPHSHSHFYLISFCGIYSFHLLFFRLLYCFVNKQKKNDFVNSLVTFCFSIVFFVININTNTEKSYIIQSSLFFLFVYLFILLSLFRGGNNLINFVCVCL